MKKKISYKQIADGITLVPAVNPNPPQLKNKMEQMEQHLLNRLERDFEYLVQQPALYMPTNPD